MTHSRPTEFSTFSKTVHWLLAAIIFILIIMGIYMGDLPTVTAEEERFFLQLYTIHQSIGIVVILLVAIKITRMLITGPQPQLPAVFAGKERMLIRSIKKLLRILMLLLPLNGYLMSNANGDSIVFFWLFELPALVGKSESLYTALYAIHMIGGWLMLLVILAHVAIIFKYWLENEGTEKDIIRRML
jgi:cytochrome b561